MKELGQAGTERKKVPPPSTPSLCCAAILRAQCGSEHDLSSDCPSACLSSAAGGHGPFPVLPVPTQ